jgi:hypothetical protein
MTLAGTPTQQSQDQAIASIIDYLRKYHDLFDEPESYGQKVHSLLLKHGRPWYIDEHTFAGRRATRKQCYLNSYALVDRDPRLIYAEGWCRTDIIFQHAWCIAPEGG